MTSATPSNAFELLLSALQSEAGFTPEQCAIVRAGLDQWGAMVQVLDGGEPVPLPAWSGPCRVHLLPRDLDEPDEEPPPAPKPSKPAPTPKPPRLRPPRPRKPARRTAADILRPQSGAPRW